MHAGLLADTRRPEHVAPARGARDRTRSTCWSSQPLPVPATVASGASAGRVRRADRHRRPGDGAGGGEEPRQRRGRRRPGALRLGARSRCRPAVSTSTDRRRLAARRSGTPPPTTSRSRPGWAACWPPDRRRAVPAVGRRRAGSASATLRYGENPHQGAALYVSGAPRARRRRAAARQGDVLQQLRRRRRGAGGPRTITTTPCVAIIKHANPCGIAVGADIAEAHRKAHACDPISAFGGVIAANRPRSAWRWPSRWPRCSPRSSSRPSYADGALEVLARKKNIRLLRLPGARRRGGARDAADLAAGAAADSATRSTPPATTRRPGPSRPAIRCRPTGWPIWSSRGGRCRSVKSNAILLAAGGATVGVGMGQVNRVDSARLAVTRAGDRAAGSVAASDAFFPFPDGLQVLIDAGVRAVVQPGGSVRDGEVIAAAEAAGVRDVPDRHPALRPLKRRVRPGPAGGADRFVEFDTSPRSSMIEVDRCRTRRSEVRWRAGARREPLVGDDRFRGLSRGHTSS